MVGDFMGLVGIFAVLVLFLVVLMIFLCFVGVVLSYVDDSDLLYWCCSWLCDFALMCWCCSWPGDGLGLVMVWGCVDRIAIWVERCMPPGTRRTLFSGWHAPHGKRLAPVRVSFSNLRCVLASERHMLL